MAVKCVASIYDIYYKMVEEKIQRKKKNQNKSKYKYNILDKENNFQGKLL